MTAVYYKQDVI